MGSPLKISVSWSIAIKWTTRNYYETERKAEHISMSCINSLYIYFASTVYSYFPAPSLKDRTKVERSKQGSGTGNMSEQTETKD